MRICFVKASHFMHLQSQLECALQYCSNSYSVITSKFKVNYLPPILNISPFKTSPITPIINKTIIFQKNYLSYYYV